MWDTEDLGSREPVSPNSTEPLSLAGKCMQRTFPFGLMSPKEKAVSCKVPTESGHQLRLGKVSSEFQYCFVPIALT